MDSYEATRTVLSRIQSLEPDNATKIMGYLLLKDYGEKEMIRFALGPDTLLHNLIFEAKTQLGLPKKSPSTPSSPFLPISRPNPLSLSSPRITNNAFDFKNSSSPSSNTCPLSGFSVSRRLNNSPVSSSSFPSYASVLNRSSDSGSGYLSSPKVSSSSTGYNFSSVNHDEYLLQNDLSFLNDSKVDLYGSRVDFASNPDTNCNNLHNPNNYSVPGTLLGAEDLNSGFGWKSCLYFARGFCKNGSSCRFLHEGSTTDGAAIVGSPNNNLNELEQCQELLRLKSAAHRQKLGSESPFETGTSFPYKNCLNFLMQQEVDNQRSATTAFAIGHQLQKFGRCRVERNDCSGMSLGGNLSPASRQIYLTFPADSTFREEDISNYFSTYGPVQDVRIPYQQKRMFGFVTFLYSETVQFILAKGNPHFVCDSRVLVKPYKEKGKLLEKKHQNMERGDYSLCSSPTTFNCVDSYDLSHGARMLNNAQEMLLMRKLEERANFQQAIDLQEGRLVNLQLLELKRNIYRYHQDLSSGSPIPSPTLSQTFNHQASIIEPNGTYQDVPEEYNLSLVATIPQTSVVDGDQQHQQVNPACNKSGVYEDKVGNEYFKIEESELRGRGEHVLPDNLFASPEKSAGVYNNSQSHSNNNPDLSSSSALNVASPKSVFSKCPGYNLLGMEPLECS